MNEVCPSWKHNSHQRTNATTEEDIFSALNALHFAGEAFRPPNALDENEFELDVIPLQLPLLTPSSSSLQFHLERQYRNELLLSSASASQTSPAHELDTPSALTLSLSRSSSDFDSESKSKNKRISIGSLNIKTYAEATNLAAKYPELASTILALPLVKAGEEEKKQQQQQQKQHTTNRPNWALAPEEKHTADKPNWAMAPNETKKRRRPKWKNKTQQEGIHEESGTQQQQQQRALLLENVVHMDATRPFEVMPYRLMDAPALRGGDVPIYEQQTRVEAGAELMRIESAAYRKLEREAGGTERGWLRGVW